jgi:hypothetical protein
MFSSSPAKDFRFSTVRIAANFLDATRSGYPSRRHGLTRPQNAHLTVEIVRAARKIPWRAARKFVWM